MEDDPIMPTSPLAANLRRCYGTPRPGQPRVIAPQADNELFMMYLDRFSRLNAEPVGAKADVARVLLLKPGTTSV